MHSALLQLWIDSAQCTWEGVGFPNVVNAGNPGDGALDAETKAAVRHTAVAAQVNIPFECFFGQVVLVDALQQ